jgi:4-amino-4-deoxy-L-arabinose transferase-like glycosyltransferase
MSLKSRLTRKYRVGLYITAGILILAAVIRFTHLNLLPVFVDESIYLRWAQVMRAESTLRFLPLSDGKQPLFMWMVIPFMKLISDPLLAGRVFSALCGLFTTVGIGVAGFILFSNIKLALSASLLWAVIPYAVFFDRMALCFFCPVTSVSALGFIHAGGIYFRLCLADKISCHVCLGFDPGGFIAG